MPTGVTYVVSVRVGKKKDFVGVEGSEGCKGNPSGARRHRAKALCSREPFAKSAGTAEDGWVREGGRVGAV